MYSRAMRPAAAGKSETVPEFDPRRTSFEKMLSGLRQRGLKQTGARPRRAPIRQPTECVGQASRLTGNDCRGLSESDRGFCAAG